MTRRHSERGFSLVQVVITLQFAGIVALIGVPKVSAFFAQYQLLSASNQMGFEITRARMQAVGQHRYVRIRMASATQYVRETSATGSSGSWSIDGVTKTLPSGVTAAQTSAQVQFDMRGFAAPNNSITLNNTLQQAKTVQTSIVGRVIIVSGVGG